MSDLETKLRELAAKGNISHISLVPIHTGKDFKGFSATYSPAAGWGHGFAVSTDPVEAILSAIAEWKPARKPRVGVKTASGDVRPAREEDLPDPTA